MIRFSSIALLLALVAGCAKPATETAPVAVTPVVDSEHSVAISVPGMMCEHGCPPMVRETLAKQPGATDVKVDFPTKTAIVTVEDKSKFDTDAAVAALEANGYKDSAVKAQ